jgi:phenylalanyl-tRNA synthetase beta chain
VKISLDWLADFVAWEDNPADLAARLTAAGLNVEAIEEVGQSYPGVVVGRVVTREDHPAADRLSVCRVDTGSGGEPIAVVCGAANVAADQTILLATVGAVLPGGLRIKRSKIRGIESHGMICSAAELLLSEEADGILVLDDDPQLGTTADEFIGYTDTVLDIEVTPNRPDWLSHLGVAREVAAIYGTKLALPSIAQSGRSGERLGRLASCRTDCAPSVPDRSTTSST